MRGSSNGESVNTLSEASGSTSSRVDIVLELENPFGISITDTEADHLQRYGEVLELVKSKLRINAAT